MDAQELNINSIASVTSDVTITDTPKITKEEAQGLSDAQLLQMIQKAQGHTNDFQNFMNCDFSYTYLTGLIKDRGYENGWHKTSEGSAPVYKPTVIIMKKSDEDTTRKSFIIDIEIAEKWKSFNENIPFPSVTLKYALQRFMDDYNAGNIKFELEV